MRRHRAGREFIAQADDSRGLIDGVHAPGKLFYVFHRNRSLRRKALHKATTGRLGKGFPKGAAPPTRSASFVVGAAGLGLTEAQVRAVQATDPRCC